MRLVRPLPDTMTQMTARRDVVTTENELCDRLVDAVPGTTITYHVGMLARDRDRLASGLAPQQRDELNALAGKARQLAEAGWADLVQRRVGEESFVYLLILRRRPLSARSRRAQLAPSLFMAEAA